MKKLLQSIKAKVRTLGIKTATALTDTRGDLATNTIGGIIVGVVIVGLLIIAINKFFPGFFSDMFGKMSDKLNGNW
ncbi:hypothetical protein KL86CLO1_11360 [uncultured Eubacteriales bacterium]|uniref:Uncharacterized protein n=1 Tax=uncultured Eubacteriales bacterium TaxID=172733 RepID=A0A212JMC8_9FIRM|nr:hypothetical protein KL86CLO1_11360 [uncultured Eubacteriales bacterium]